MVIPLKFSDQLSWKWRQPPDPNVVSNKLIEIIYTLCPVSYWELFGNYARQLGTIGDKITGQKRRPNMYCLSPGVKQRSKKFEEELKSDN